MFLKRCGSNSQSLNAIKHGSSHPDKFRKKGVLRNFTKFTGKHPCQSLLFNKVAGLRSFFIEHLWWLIVKAIATLFSVGKASKNRVSCFSRLFLTKVKVSINESCIIRKSALNYCLMARSFLLFHMCWNHSFSQQKVQTFLSPFKLMIHNTICRLCEQNNLFLSSIYLRTTVFARFSTNINKLPQQQKK